MLFFRDNIFWIMIFSTINFSCFDIGHYTSTQPYPPVEKSIEDATRDYIGWWVYGEGQHIFKDEFSLEEWDIHFLNEDIEEMSGLYLSVTEMEYFPIECKMTGRIVGIRDSLSSNLVSSQIHVETFEILYIEGCGEIEENE